MAERKHTASPQVWIVRHGETAWSLSGQHTGRTDIPLTPRGEKDAQALNSRLAAQTFDRVLSSPLQRARQTCELAGFSGRHELSDDLLEWNYGEYEGRRTVEIRAARPGWNAFEQGYPGGETLADVSARADQLIARIRSDGVNALMFAHRDILRIVAARWVNLPAIEARRFYLDPVSVSVLAYDHSLDEPIIRTLNT